MKLITITCPVCESPRFRPTNTCRIAKADFPLPLTSLSLVRCLSCGLRYVNPRPVLDEAEKKRIYGADYFDSEYMRFYGARHPLEDACPDDEEAVQTNETFSRRLALIERFTRRGRLLDVGCAYGGFLNFAATRGWEVYGVEVSPEASTTARKKYGLSVITGDIQKTDLRDNFFDVVSCGDVLEHIEEPVFFLKRAAGILKDDGVLYLAAPNAESLYYKVFGAVNSINHKNYFLLPYHIVHYAPQTLRLVLEKSGFKIEYLVLSNSRTLEKGPRKVFIAALNLLAGWTGRQDRVLVIARKVRS